MSRLGKTLPLHVFVRRQQVLRLYRDMLKSARSIEDVLLKQSLKAQIKTEFRIGAALVDNNATKTAIAHGQRCLVQLDELSGRKRDSRKTEGSWLDTKDEQDVRGRVGSGWPWS